MWPEGAGRKVEREYLYISKGWRDRTRGWLPPLQEDRDGWGRIVPVRVMEPSAPPRMAGEGKAGEMCWGSAGRAGQAQSPAVPRAGDKGQPGTSPATQSGGRGELFSDSSDSRPPRGCFSHHSGHNFNYVSCKLFSHLALTALCRAWLSR